MSEPGRKWRDMVDYVKNSRKRENMAKHSKTWQNTMDNEGTLGIMGEHSRTRQNMTKHFGIWQKMAENGGTWCNIAAEMKMSQAMQACLS